jgi:hypothetical protein
MIGDMVGDALGPVADAFKVLHGGFPFEARRRVRFRRVLIIATIRTRLR